MSGMHFEGRPTAAELAIERRIRRIEALRERDAEIQRLHTRLDALLFWAALMLALGAIGLQLGWAP